MQLALFDHGRAPEIDADLGAVQRLWLDEEAWVDWVPGWVRGHDALWEMLEGALDWRHHRRRMYERYVDVPRLTASVSGDVAGQVSILGDMSRVLSERYGAQLGSITFAYYRDGRDSVAWHRDKGVRDRDDGVVAIVSLGGPRSFQLRPLGGGASRSISVGWGDLVVMGGMACRTWEHRVPKVSHAHPRICIMFRETYAEPEQQDGRDVSEARRAG